jgi:ribosome-binding protein aMBF1 (putative translation factor)
MSGYGKPKQTFDDQFAVPQTVVLQKRPVSERHAPPPAQVIAANKLDNTDGHAPQLASVTHDQKQLIQQARVARGLSQKQLASDLSISVKQIQDWEAGRGAPPKGGDKAKIQRKLGIKL